MTQISILRGIYADGYSRLRESYPVNLEPQVVSNGVSYGSLRSAAGISWVADGPGADRGGIVFQDVHYRVMGTKLCSVTGTTVNVIGDVGAGGPTPMDYSFTDLGIISGTRFYLYNVTQGLRQVTDPNLGAVIDLVWVDGYFMLTDGTSLVVTSLNDPTTIIPNAYGSSESDPDPIVGLVKVRGQIYAVNRNTTENFYDAGLSGTNTFPFARNSGAIIMKGAVGTNALTLFADSFAFVGSARNEAPSVYIAGNGTAVSISTPEIDRELAALDQTDLQNIECEARTEKNEQRLLIHLPTVSLVYSLNASQVAQTPVWHKLAGGVMADQVYPARHVTLQDGKWFLGSPMGKVGTLDETVSTQFGAVAGWQFDTSFIYNASKGGILNALELVALPGSAPLGSNPVAFLSLTRDGKVWGQERAISAGKIGESLKRLQWRPHSRFSNYVGCRFRGADTGIASFMRLEAEIEPLSV